MGRSVSYPSNAKVAFMAPSFFDYEEHGDNEDAEYDFYDFDDLIEWAQGLAAEVWPSMSDCNEWLDREDHAIAENGHAYFGVSEYGGLCAFWLVARDPDSALAENWLDLANAKLQKHFGELRKIAVMSNGEAIYERRAA